MPSVVDQADLLVVQMPFVVDQVDLFVVQMPFVVDQLDLFVVHTPLGAEQVDILKQQARVFAPDPPVEQGRLRGPRLHARA